MSFCLLVIAAADDSIGSKGYLIPLVFLCEFLFTRKIIENCRAKVVNNVNILYIYMFLILFVFFVFLYRFSSINILGFVCALYAISVHLVMKFLQIYLHTGYLISMEVVDSKFKFGRIGPIDGGIPKKMGYEAIITLCICIVIVTFPFLFSVIHIISLDSEGVFEFQDDIKYFISLFAITIICFLYYSVISYLVVLKGKSENYIAERQ